MKRTSLRNVIELAIVIGIVGMTQQTLAEEMHEPEPGKRLEMLKEKLNLNEEQANKISEIFAEGRGSCKSLEDPSEKRTCRQNMRESKRTQIDSVLTPEQKEKFAQLRKERREKIKERKRGGMEKMRHKQK